MRVHILDLEVEDERAVGVCSDDAIAIRAGRRTGGGNRQTRARASLKFDIAAAYYLGFGAGNGFVEARQLLHIFGNEPALLKIHLHSPFLHRLPKAGLAELEAKPIASFDERHRAVVIVIARA